MRNTVIPKKYLTIRYSMDAFHRLRKWCSDDTRIIRAAEEVVDAYEHANEDTRRYLARLLAMIMGLRSEDFSRKCMTDTDLTVLECRSVGESIYSDYKFLMGNPQRSVCMSPCVWDWKHLKKKINLARHRYFIRKDDTDNLLTISSDDGIYVCRHKDGSVRIFIINDCDNGMLIDEQSFNDDCPLYFTESRYFISPVFKIKVVIKILNFFLAEIGYPSVCIIPDVIFPSPGAYFVNKDVYMPGGECFSAWKGINVTTRMDTKGLYILNSIVGFIDNNPECVERDLLAYKLMEAISATALMYSKIKWSPDLLYKTLSDLRKMAKSFGIMTDKKT